ncbi:MAG: ribonuclease III [Caldilineaceae bacterium]|nr:ribonuclease III [Caldilineaceae bacterium]MCB0127496.1 ribonuclease III [Caldilineaceae bacterium]MCB0186458.1 ribonuclease III [Caldilineaceae bacterium]HRW07608.1 ribonuclease III [Caldilineaceae bacterium]
MNGAEITQLQKSLPLTFHNVELLQRAFIHRSYLNEAGEESGLADNERLEFLGDSVLGFVMSEYLFAQYPTFQEGPLTNLRAALVRRETLAKLATQWSLGDYLWLGNGEEESDGRQRPATLCAVFEALIGAIYLDQGVEAVRSFVLPMMKKELKLSAEAALGKDAKSRMQEYAQRTFSLTPRYREVDSSGPDHDRTFIMTVTIGGKVYGVGQGRSKGEATQTAAAMGLYRLGQHAPEYEPNPALAERFADDLRETASE